MRTNMETGIVTVIWTLLSALVAITSTFSFFQPSWITDNDRFTRFGLVKYCHRVIDGKELFAYQVCRLYGKENLSFSDYPSKAWQASCILYGGGSAVLCIAAVLSILSLIFSYTSSCDKKVTVYTGYIQLIAVVLMIAGQVVYPFGLDSSLVQAHCGPRAGQFSAGRCNFGWAYMLAITSTAVAVFCPFFAHCTDFSKRHRTTSEFV